MAANKKAAAASGAKANTKRVPRKLAEEIGRRIAGSLLPDEPELTGKALDEAAKFTARTAMQRDADEPTFAIETISGSASERFMRIAIVNDDMPFLVDSIALTLANAGAAIHRLVHPVLCVERNAKGRLEDVPKNPAKDCRRESMIYIETDRIDAKHRHELEKAIASTLADTRAAVTDWPRMQELMAADAERIAGDSEEGADGVVDDAFPLQDLCRPRGQPGLSQQGRDDRGSGDDHDPAEDDGRFPAQPGAENQRKRRQDPAQRRTDIDQPPDARPGIGQLFQAQRQAPLEQDHGNGQRHDGTQQFAAATVEHLLRIEPVSYHYPLCVFIHKHRWFKAYIVYDFEFSHTN